MTRRVSAQRRFPAAPRSCPRTSVFSQSLPASVKIASTVSGVASAIRYCHGHFGETDQLEQEVDTVGIKFSDGQRIGSRVIARALGGLAWPASKLDVASQMIETETLLPTPWALPARPRFCARGGCAFPTETVYGLGGDARSHLAVARIFNTKKRPQGSIR